MNSHKMLEIHVFLEIVETVAGPDGDLARRVALVQLEIHVENSKLAPTQIHNRKRITHIED